MDIDIIIESVNKRNQEFKTKFFNKIVEYLRNHVEIPKLFTKEYESRIGSKISYILEALKIYFIDQKNNHEFWLESSGSLVSSKDDEFEFCRSLHLSNQGKNNLFYQLSILNNNTVHNIDPNKIKEIDQDLFFVVRNKSFDDIINDINHKNQKIKLTDPRQILIFFGIESLDFLNHQDSNRFTNFVHSTDYRHQQSTNHFANLLELSNSLDDDTRDRIVLFSGITLQFLGANYTKDVDIIYYMQNANALSIKNIKEFAENNHDTFDFKFYTDFSDNVDNTKEIMVDPKQYFYFLGLKCMSVRQLIQRCYKRSVSGSYVDLLMLNRINNYHIDLCLPLVVTNYGMQIVYTPVNRNKLINDIIKKMYIWFNIKINRDEIDNMIKYCENRYHDSMTIEPGLDPTSHNIKEYLNCATREIVKKYSKKGIVLEIDRWKDRLYDCYDDDTEKVITLVDCDKTVNIIKKKTSNINYETIVKKGGLMDVNVIEEIKNIQFDFVFLRHELERNIEDINEKIKILKNIVKSEGVVIISMLNGDIVKNLTMDADFLIKTKNITRFGVYNFDKRFNNKYVVYMDRIYEYDKGMLTDVISPSEIIKLLNANGFSVILDISYKDISGFNEFNELKSNLNHVCLRSINLFYIIVAKKYNQSI